MNIVLKCFKANTCTRCFMLFFNRLHIPANLLLFVPHHNPRARPSTRRYEICSLKQLRRGSLRAGCPGLRNAVRLRRTHLRSWRASSQGLRAGLWNAVRLRRTHPLHDIFPFSPASTSPSPSPISLRFSFSVSRLPSPVSFIQHFPSPVQCNSASPWNYKTFTNVLIAYIQEYMT
jgi:hypothetical protein